MLCQHGLVARRFVFGKSKRKILTAAIRRHRQQLLTITVRYVLYSCNVRYYAVRQFLKIHDFKLNVRRSSAHIQYRGVAGGLVRGAICRYKQELSSRPLRSYAPDVCLATFAHFEGRKFSSISRLQSHPSSLVRVARSTCSQRRMRRN